MEPKFKPVSIKDNSSKTEKVIKKKERRYKWVFLVAALIIISGLIWAVLFSSSSAFHFVYSSPLNPLKNPLNSTDDRVNVLLLGNAGGKHDGPGLTDSIIVASYNLKTNEVTLISIPRDLWIPTARAKINTLYVVGEKNDQGLEYASDKIDDILGLPIHYAVRLDFNGFAKAVDTVGGVDVEVEKTFDDYMYPIAGREDDLCGYKEEERDFNDEQAKQLNITPGKRKVFIDPQGNVATDSAKIEFTCRYEHIHFDRGLTHMDGETALKFVRSRHGLNGEGSDFARSKRQQLVLEAFREKALSLQTLANPAKMIELLGAFGDSFETNIPTKNFLDFYNLVKKRESSKNIVLGQLGNGQSLFINPPLTDYGGAWVLVPPNDDFSEVQRYLHDELERVATESATVVEEN